MSQYSETIGSFTRTGNYPLEANYIFQSEEELKQFYSDPIQKATLHEGLFKIVKTDNKQFLYWVVDGENGLEFKKLDIEDGAITIEKIATSAFDSTLSVSGKIAPADVVGKNLDELDKKVDNAILKNKGYFTSVEKLNEAIPNPTIGSKAYVGTSEPYAIYIVENGAWVDSGYTGGVEDFNLGEYMVAMKSVDFKQTSPNVIEYEETKFNDKKTKSIPQATETFAGAMSAQYVKDLKSSVKVTKQSFTDIEKKQVCANIGVIKMDTTKTEDQILNMIDSGEIDSETLYIITQ